MPLVKKPPLYLVCLGLVVILAIIIGLSFRSHTKVSPAIKAPITSSVGKTRTAGNAIGSAGSSTKINTNSTSSANSSLSNTGPGNVLGLFVIASASATLLHWRWRAHKLY